MRRLLLSALIVASPLALSAAQAVDTSTTQFDVNGLKVILRRNAATDVVAANLYLLGGARQLTPATQGIEALIFAASEGGSRKYPGPRLRQELARVGSEVRTSLSEDWITYSLKALRSTFDTSWAMFSDRL